MTRLVVFAGGPGGGKTTVLRALELRGYDVVGDSAREIIRDRKSRSLSPRPPPLVFAQEILLRDMRQYAEHAVAAVPVFFERGVVDALGMLHEAGGISDDDLRRRLAMYPYYRRVFIFPPWEEIYATDAERDQTFDKASRVCKAVAGWYRRCGYETVEVPRTSVNERGAFVLRVLDGPEAQRAS